MNDLPLISVIIPVYNVERYLNECLNSVLVQTFHNIEIILVNDGSTDKTEEICDEFAKKDNRVHVFHKGNTGVASSRNVGVDLASGDFIIFVDGDDVADNQLIEVLYDNLMKYNADISICGLKTFDKKRPESVHKKQETIVMNNIEAIESMFYQRHFDTGPVAKLYKSSIVKKNRFPDGKIFEDLYTVYKFLNDAEKVVFTPEVYYYYRQNEISLMHKDFENSILDELLAIDEIEDFVNNEHPELETSFLSRKFSSYCQVFGWIPENNNNDELAKKKNHIWVFIKIYRIKMMKDKKARSKNRLAAMLSFGGEYLFYRLLLLNKAFKIKEK